jgi:hypothetical protein
VHVGKVSEFLLGYSLGFPKLSDPLTELGAEKRVPVQQLIDTGLAKYPTVVIPLASMNMKMASFLWSLELARLPNDGGSFEIQIINDVWKTSISRETRFGIAQFNSVSQMIVKIDETIKTENAERIKKLKSKYQRYIGRGNTSRLQDAYIQGALRKIIRRNKARETLTSN